MNLGAKLIKNDPKECDIPQEHTFFHLQQQSTLYFGRKLHIRKSQRKNELSFYAIYYILPIGKQIKIIYMELTKIHIYMEEPSYSVIIPKYMQSLLKIQDYLQSRMLLQHCPELLC